MKLLTTLPALISVTSATCYDGNNGGCSHTCNNSECSCPPCWTLGADGKTCEFEDGKATVTCSATGAQIAIDKCALTGVDANSIHLKDAACAATQDPANENIWMINTGFDNCASEFGYASDVDKLTLSNTLSIGNSVVGGRIVSRRYDIAFSCMFNNVAEATSSISASNTIYSELTFNINQDQPAELGFPFNLNFYESEAFTTLADLTTGAFQPGAALFGSVTPASALPPSLMFSVGKCTVEDTTITQSLDVLDTCPVDGLSFEFKNTQSDASAVNFAFQGFVFPTSADDTTIDVTCAVNVCPVDSPDCLKLCDQSSPQADTNIMVITNSLDASFVINGDGSTKSAARIIAPNYSNEYTNRAVSAVVADQLYIFGGKAVDVRKIARLDGCTIVELSVRLNQDFNWAHSALAIESGSKALICFGNTSPFNYCDVFNGVSVVTTHSSAYSHGYGGLAFYNGRPTTVGSSLSNGFRKVETLTETGWQQLDDFSEYLYGHNLVGLANGDMLLIGGYDTAAYIYQNSIWRLRADSGTWAEDGALQKAVGYGSAMLVDETIYSFAGQGGNSEFPIQRIIIDKDFTINKVETIGDQGNYYAYSILHVVETNVCV